MIKKIITFSLILFYAVSHAMNDEENTQIVPAAYKILKDRFGKQVHTWHSNDLSITYYTPDGTELATLTGAKKYPMDPQQAAIAFFYARGKNRSGQRSVILFDKNRYELGYKNKINAATIEQALEYAARELNIELTENITLEPNVDYLDDRIHRILHS